MRDAIWVRVVRGGLAIGAVSACAGALGGCWGYVNYPPIEGASPGINNPNAPPADELMILATKWVADRYPPPRSGPEVAGEAQFAVNLPPGVRRDLYERVAAKTAGRAVPLTETNAKTLPIYHIARVWVRMRDAKVDVLRPRLELPRRPDGQPVYECVTLLIEGGLKPWRVTQFQTWEVGVVDPPPLNFCPEEYGPEVYPPGTKRPVKATATVPEDRPVDSSGVPPMRSVEEEPPVKDEGTGDGR